MSKKFWFLVIVILAVVGIFYIGYQLGNRKNQPAPPTATETSTSVKSPASRREIEQVIRSFLSAIDRGNLVRAKDYLALEFRNPNMKKLETDITNLKGKIGRVTIKKVIICAKKDLESPTSVCYLTGRYADQNGDYYDYASIFFSFREGYDSDSIDLVRIRGRWKVAFWNILYL